MGNLISILHADKEWGIGKKNDLMFSLKKDMAFFRNTTKGHVVCMGENTLLSFPNGKPLKNRTNIVLSKSSNYDDVINVHSFDEFLKVIKEKLQEGDVFIIGGASIYRQTLPYVDYVYLTKVDAIGNAEVFFENLDENKNFKLISSTPYEEDNGYMISFTTYQNINKKEF